MLRIRMDYSGAPLDETLHRAVKPAETVVASEVLKDIRKHLPARTTSLIKRSHIERGNIVVIPGPYARYLDAGKVMVDEKGRGPFPTPDGPRFHRGAVLHPIEKDLVISTAVNPKATSHFVDVTIKECMTKWVRVADKAVKNGLG